MSAFVDVGYQGMTVACGWRQMQQQQIGHRKTAIVHRMLRRLLSPNCCARSDQSTTAAPEQRDRCESVSQQRPPLRLPMALLTQPANDRSGRSSTSVCPGQRPRASFYCILSPNYLKRNATTPKLSHMDNCGIRYDSGQSRMARNSEMRCRYGRTANRFDDLTASIPDTTSSNRLLHDAP